MIPQKQEVQLSTKSFLYLPKKISFDKKADQMSPFIIRCLSNKRYALIYPTYVIILDYPNLPSNSNQTIEYPALTSEYDNLNFYSFLFTQKELVIQCRQFKMYSNNQWNTLPIKRTKEFEGQLLYFNSSNTLCLVEIRSGVLQVCCLNNPSLSYKLNINWQLFLQADQHSLILISGQLGHQLMFFDILSQKEIRLKINLKLTFMDIIDSIFLLNQSQILVVIKYDKNYSIFHYKPSKITRLPLDLDNYDRVMIGRRCKNNRVIAINGFDKIKYCYKSIVCDYQNQVTLLDQNTIQALPSSIFSPNLDFFARLQVQEKSFHITFYNGVKKNNLYIHLIKEGGFQSLFGRDILKQVVKVLH